MYSMACLHPEQDLRNVNGVHSAPRSLGLLIHSLYADKRERERKKHVHPINCSYVNSVFLLVQLRMPLLETLDLSIMG